MRGVLASANDASTVRHEQHEALIAWDALHDTDERVVKQLNIQAHRYDTAISRDDKHNQGACCKRLHKHTERERRERSPIQAHSCYSRDGFAFTD